MNEREATALIRPAVAAAGGRWADLGAGAGVFTRALAAVLGPDASIVAVDRDAAAMSELRAWADARGGRGARVETVVADLARPERVPGLDTTSLDGALLANVLHFFPDPAPLLRAVAAWLRPGGRVVVVEYDRRPASRWVPHPLAGERLADLAAGAGLLLPVRVGERPSAYGGVMYCAYAVRPPASA